MYFYRIFSLLPARVLAPLLIVLVFSACSSGGSDESAASETTNNIPSANAGPDQQVHTGSSIVLDASSSSDSDGDSLTYLWSITSAPIGSVASIENTTSSITNFSCDLSGNYILALVVNDGVANSTTDSMTLTCTNTAPLADDKTVSTLENNQVQIELAASDEDADSLSFTIVTPPLNGAVELSGNNATYTPNENFVGNDSFSFQANDGFDDSNLATVSIQVDSTASATTLSDGKIVNTAALVNLGNQIYHDTNLSTPVGQSCASCHDLSTGFDDPDSNDPSSLGADGISFGTRNSPTASYSAFIPALTQAPGPGGGPIVGGLFWDGRADSLEEQAKGPFLNPVEMGNADEQTVINKISNASYASDFENLFGAGIFSDITLSYNYIADAIAAFERTEIFSPFSSKFDRVQAGIDTFTASEARGQQVFRGKGDCVRCHRDNTETILFTDFQYKNIGVPSNSLLPAYMSDSNFVDLGLGAETGNANHNGQFRTPTLRNIAITAPYMHNGVFSTLEEVIDFYNTRDTTFADSPEVNQNVDQGGNIGELNLTADEITDLIAFLNTLTDE